MLQIIQKIEKKDLIYYFLFLGCICLVSTAYVGINGNHSWRQADVYGHILGFMAWKGFQPLSSFEGGVQIYDIPIYQYSIAKIALLLNSDPLVVTRFFNMGFWLILALGGFKLSEKISEGAGILFLFFIITSPLFLHYYTTPLPDVMATSLSMLSVYLMLEEDKNNAYIIIASFLIFFSALIKSPVSYIFIIYFSLVNKNGLGKKQIFYVSSAIFATFSAEFLRKLTLNTDIKGFAQDPNWYFGTFDQRITIEFWETLINRMLEIFPSNQIGFLIIAYLPISLIINFRKNKIYILFFLPYFAGWLTFSNLYERHDYYQIPSLVIIIIGLSVFYTEIINKIRNDKYQKIIYLILCLISPILLLSMEKKSELSIANIYDCMSYALKDENFFLLVTDKNDGPTLGGKLKTKFTRVGVSKFENDCIKLVSENKAIVVDGYSECLVRKKEHFKIFIQDDKFQLAVKY